MTSRSNEDFADLANKVLDRAAAAARADNIGTFQTELALLQRLYAESLTILAGINEREPGLQRPVLFGWHAFRVWDVLTDRLGQSLFSFGSPQIIGEWLYFPQELLRATRYMSARQPFHVMRIWVGAAANMPQKGRLWIRLHEYLMEANSEVQGARTTAELTSVAAELAGMLMVLRHIVVNLDPTDFPQLGRISDEVGKFIISSWVDQLPPTQQDAVDRLRQVFADELVGLKRQLWLGYAGHLLAVSPQQTIPAENARAQWGFIAQQFPTLWHLWLTWKAMQSDPFQWSQERLHDQARAEGATYEPVASGWVDRFGGTTQAFLLLACNLPTDVDLAPDESDAEIVQQWLLPELSRLRGSLDACPDFALPASSDEVRRRLSELESRFREAAHGAEALRNARLATAPLDANRVEAIWSSLFTPLIYGEPSIVRMAGTSVQFLEGGKSRRHFVRVGVDLSAPRASLIEGEDQEFVVSTPLLLEGENAIVLSEAARVTNPRVVARIDDVPSAIHRAVDRLVSLGMPPSIIGIGGDFRILQAIRASEHLQPTVDSVQNPWLVGMWNGIPVFSRGLHLDRGILLIAAVEAWLRIEVRRPDPPIRKEVPRFRALVVESNPEELEAEVAAGNARSSRVGIPFEAKDLRNALRSQVILRVEEHLSVRVKNKSAAIALRLAE